MEVLLQRGLGVLAEKEAEHIRSAHDALRDEVPEWQALRGFGAGQLCFDGGREQLVGIRHHRHDRQGGEMRQQAFHIGDEELAGAELAARRLCEAEVVRLPDAGNVADRVGRCVSDGDAGKKAEEDVQKLTDSFIKKIDELLAVKEAEIMKV